jgi:hypothetical protein
MKIKEIIEGLREYNKSLNEDLNKIKDRIDKDINSEKDVDKIDADINYMSDNSNEKEEAQEYATQKMLEK